MEKTINRTIIRLVQGDITVQVVDAIVNAANSSLLGGGGVDGAIHRAGGPAILEECKLIRKRQGECPPGEAVITTAGKMPSKYVVHTVGPIWRGGGADEPQTLRNAYWNSLTLAEENSNKSIAFPSISTGVYGYPVDQAAPIAVATVAEYCGASVNFVQVMFVLHDPRTFAAYESALKAV